MNEIPNIHIALTKTEFLYVKACIAIATDWTQQAIAPMPELSVLEDERIVKKLKEIFSNKNLLHEPISEK